MEVSNIFVICHRMYSKTNDVISKTNDVFPAFARPRTCSAQINANQNIYISMIALNQDVYRQASKSPNSILKDSNVFKMQLQKLFSKRKSLIMSPLYLTIFTGSQSNLELITKLPLFASALNLKTDQVIWKISLLHNYENPSTYKPAFEDTQIWH